MIMVASLQPDFFTGKDAAFVQSAARWVGMVAHRAELLEEIERSAVEQGRRSAAEEVITILAHDLRNYVSPVVLRLYSVRHRAEAAQRVEDLEDINLALDGLARLNALLSNLLDVARIDEGIFQMHVEPVDIVALVKEAASVLSTPEHQVIVKATDAVVVAADPIRIRQCLDNLLGTQSRIHRRGEQSVSSLLSK
jgi:two-component system, OmpR family, sensor kinase